MEYSLKAKEYITEQPIKLIFILSILSIGFIMLGHIYKDAIQTRLKRELFRLPSSIVDYWSVAHLLLFMAFGFIYPGYNMTFLIGGVAWELLEDFLAANPNTQLVNCVKNPNKIWCNGIQTDYWYGKWDDICANTLGYIIGEFIRKTMFSW